MSSSNSNIAAATTVLGEAAATPTVAQELEQSTGSTSIDATSKSISDAKNPVPVVTLTPPPTPPTQSTGTVKMPVKDTAASEPEPASTDAASEVAKSSSPQIINPNGFETNTSAAVTPVNKSSRTTEALASTYEDLQLRYLAELQYMHREFAKLQEQLLRAAPAKEAAAAAVAGGEKKSKELAASKERQEKLGSFIQHLQETMEQIKAGCNNPPQPPQPPQTIADLVQCLEEHILTNLLPVKQRLKKQLAAQQGAKHNPAGIVVKQGTGGSTAQSKGSVAPTFGGGARKSSHLFGKSLPKGGGSCLTQKLHGQTLGSTTAADASSSQKKKNILVAGMAMGSHPQQRLSSVAAAKSAHGMIVQDPLLVKDLRGNTAAAAGSSYASSSPLPTSLLEAAHSGLEDPTAIAANTTATAEPSMFSSKNNLASSDWSGQTDVTMSIASPTLPPLSPTAPSPVSGISSEGKQKVISQASAPALAAPLTANSSCCSSTAATTSGTTSLSVATAVSTAKQQHPHRLSNTKTVQQQSVAASTTPSLQASHNNGNKLRHSGKKRKRNRGSSKRRLRCRSKQQQQQQQRKTGVGPRNVEYLCAACNEVYTRQTNFNPWWALLQDECPKCGKTQIPRVDISAPANEIQYHPALLAHADDNAAAAAATGNFWGFRKVATDNNNDMADSCSEESDYSSDSEGSDQDAPVQENNINEQQQLSAAAPNQLAAWDCYDDSDNENASICGVSPSDPEQAEKERFGYEYSGPRLSDEDASRLLILMQHASTCPGQHTDPRARDVCKSVKYMMLHIRDCPGTVYTDTNDLDICPFPWCRKVKHLLYHLVSCVTPDTCRICSPDLLTLSPNMFYLSGLNDHRLQKRREAIRAKQKMKQKAASVIMSKTPPSSQQHLQQNQQSTSACCINKAKVPAAVTNTAVRKVQPIVASTAPETTLQAKGNLASTTKASPVEPARISSTAAVSTVVKQQEQPQSNVAASINNATTSTSAAPKAIESPQKQQEATLLTPKTSSSSEGTTDGVDGDKAAPTVGALPSDTGERALSPSVVADSAKNLDPSETKPVQNKEEEKVLPHTAVSPNSNKRTTRAVAAAAAATGSSNCLVKDDDSNNKAVSQPTVKVQ